MGAAYGFQGMALTDLENQAGDFFNPGTFTQISLLNGVEYVEHSGPAVGNDSYLFTAEWTAPIKGTGNVTIFACGVVGNGNDKNTFDDPTSPITVLLTEDTTTSIADITSTSSLIIYPNPTTDYIVIGRNYLGKSEASIIDVRGKTVKRFKSNSDRISISELPSGIYFVKLVDGKTSVVRKFLKH